MCGRPHQLGHQRFQAVRRAVFAAVSLPAPAAIPVPGISRLEGRGCQGAGLQCWQGRALRGCACGRSPGGQCDRKLAAGGLDSHVHVPPRVLRILLLPTGTVLTKAAKYFARCKVKVASGGQTTADELLLIAGMCYRVLRTKVRSCWQLGALLKVSMQ